MSKPILHKRINHKHYKYRLLKDVEHNLRIKLNSDISGLNFYLTSDGKLVNKAGYLWDGASGPTIDCEASMRASLVHDTLYVMIHKGLLSYDYKKIADKYFHQILLEDGMNRFRAYYYYLAVKFFGLSRPGQNV